MVRKGRAREGRRRRRMVSPRVKTDSMPDGSVSMTPVSSSLVQRVGEVKQVSRLVEDGLMPSGGGG